MLTNAGEIRLVDLGSAYVCFKDKKQRISGTKYFAPKEQFMQGKEKFFKFGFIGAINPNLKVRSKSEK